MRRRTAACCIVLGFVVHAFQFVHCQTTVNPDISVIPRFRIDSNDGERLTEGIRKFSRPDFQFEELELAFQAYLNPFARADVILTLPGPDLEKSKLGIEEVYATVLRGLPFDLNLRIGKYRVDYGKINMVHPHAYPFITQPLSQARFFGEEGLNDLGISASILLPTGDVYSKLTVDLLRGNSVANAAGISDTTGASPLYATSGRLMAFFSLSDESDLETGLSTYTGIHDPYNHERFWYFNGDFKFKWRPSSYTSLVVQGEYLYNTRHASQDARFVRFTGPFGRPITKEIHTGGMYVYADYQFFKLYSIGMRYDWSESPYSSDNKARAFSLFAGYYPVEETLGVRFEYQRTTGETLTTSQVVNALALQVLFSLGPHKAHPF
ncbi:MAG: hypothetical protein WB699_05770 [Bacteroidota bacterium]